jgi:hypothetical protein
VPISTKNQDEFAANLARYVSGANPKSELTPEQAADGAHLCFVNTNELLHDARLLASSCCNGSFLWLIHGDLFVG